MTTWIVHHPSRSLHPVRGIYPEHVRAMRIADIEVLVAPPATIMARFKTYRPCPFCQPCKRAR